MPPGADTVRLGSIKEYARHNYQAGFLGERLDCPMSRRVTRMFCAVTAGFALIASGLATGCAAGAVRPSVSGRTAQSAIICCVSAVAATSVRNAWAVGGGPRTVILRWNGKAWRRVPSPNPTAGILEGVAAASARSAWAVGSIGGHTLILHWTGTVWEQVHSPNPTPDHGENLTGVAATSARNAWVAGYAAGGGQVLIAHWNGVSWMT